MAFGAQSSNETMAGRALGLFGGTPNSAGETPALPKTSAPRVAHASLLRGRAIVPLRRGGGATLG
jgi:hypothetical protein